MRLALQLGAMLVSGALLFMSYGLQPWWPAAWLAPIPLLIVAFAASARTAWWFACGAGLIGGLSTFTYYVMLTTPVLAVALTLLLALLWGVVVTLTRRMVVSAAHWTRVFAFPVLWAALDTLIARVSPHGSAGSLAYSQMDALPVIQIASLAGTPGIVFVVTLLGSLVAVEVHRRRRDEPSDAALPLLVLAVILGYGFLRLATTATPTTMPVGLAALDTRPAARVGVAGDPLWSAYARGVETLAQRGARLVVLPEKIDAVDAEVAPALQRRLGALAKRHNVHLVAGVTLVSDERRENRAWLFSPSGTLAADYSKQHLIPGLERAFSPGSEDVVVRHEADHFGVVICKDLDFPGLGRHYALRGAEIMLVPAWDFQRDAWLHSRWAVLRGVESGFAIVRAARNGRLTVSDRYGRVLAELPSAADRMALLAAAAPRGGTPTPYAYRGDVFGWICVILALVIWLRALLVRVE
jgi:apolipoprotein N-acyltransferase